MTLNNPNPVFKVTPFFEAEKSQKLLEIQTQLQRNTNVDLRRT